MNFNSWALTAVVFLPLVGLAVVLLIPKEDENAIKQVTLLTTLATLAASLYVLFHWVSNKFYEADKLAAFVDEHGRTPFEVNKTWIDVINSNYHIEVDGLGLPMMVLSAFVTVLCVVYSWNHFPEPHNPKAFLALVLLLEVGMNGTFVAQDLILFFIFFEIVLLPMYFMIDRKSVV